MTPRVARLPVLGMLMTAAIVAAAGPIAAQAVGGQPPSRTELITANALNLANGWRDPGVQTLARAIGDARVVMLGEPWHGDGGAIRARTELVRLLHQHMGFDVLVLEADFYSLHQSLRPDLLDANVRDAAAANVYHFWSISRAATPLWDYVAAQRSSTRPLHIAGVDIRHTGERAQSTLAGELDRRVAALTGVDSSTRATFRASLRQLLEREWNAKPARADQEVFLAVLTRLGDELSARDSARREPFWEQELRNLRHAALFAWRGANRDREMGENLAWLATHMYPGRKLIVWAHNNHIVKDKWMVFASDDPAVFRGGRPSLESIARSTFLGHEVRQYFGPSVFSLAVLSHSGEYSRDVRTENLRERGNFDLLTTLAPTPQGTIEATLAAAGHEMAFLDLRNAPRAALPARALDYSQAPPMRMPWHEGFDGFLFLRRTFGLDQGSTPP